MSIAFDEQLDARGLQCPLPLLKMKQVLNRLNNGQTIYVVTTDAGSVRDFNAFVKQAGHTMVAEETKDFEYHFWIRKSDQ